MDEIVRENEIVGKIRKLIEDLYIAHEIYHNKKLKGNATKKNSEYFIKLYNKTWKETEKLFIELDELLSGLRVGIFG